MFQTIVPLMLVAFLVVPLVLNYFVTARSSGHKKAFQQVILFLLVIVLTYFGFNILPSDWARNLFAGLYGIGLSVCAFLIGLHILHQRVSGAVLLNLGTKDKNGWPVFFALIFAPIMIGITVEDFTQTRFDLEEATQHAFYASGCALIVLTGMSKIKFTEDGILSAPELLRWDSILAYHWEEESTVLVLKINRRLPLRKLVRLPIPTDQKVAVEDILLQKVAYISS